MPSAILLTTDLSDAARAAYPHAVRLAKAYNLPIRLLHVVDRVMQFNAAEFGDSEAWLQALTAHRKQDMEREAAQLVESGVHVTPTTILGRAVGDIVEFAHSARVVVMSSHGYSGFRRFFLGSVASRVVQRSPAPLLVVNARSAERAFDTALFGTDLSPSADQALDHALKLLKPLKTAIEIFHADVNPSLITELRNERFEVPGVGSRSEYETVVDDRLQIMAARARQADVPATAFHEQSKRAAEAIVARADLRDDALIVIASHGRGRMSVAWLGSTCDEVLRLTERPVLILRPEREPLEG